MNTDFHLKALIKQLDSGMERINRIGHDLPAPACDDVSTVLRDISQVKRDLELSMPHTQADDPPLNIFPVTTNHQKKFCKSFFSDFNETTSLLEKYFLLEALYKAKIRNEKSGFNLIISGPLGCGKSWLAKYIAAHLIERGLAKNGVHLNAVQFLEKHFGESAKKIYALDSWARKKKAVVIIDDLHTLVDGHISSHGDPAGNEAMEALSEVMEAAQGDGAHYILTGLGDKMALFGATHPVLRNKFDYALRLRNKTVQECKNLAYFLLNKNDMHRMSVEAEHKFLALLESTVKKPGFRGAYDIASIISAIYTHRLERLTAEYRDNLARAFTTGQMDGDTIRSIKNHIAAPLMPEHIPHSRYGELVFEHAVASECITPENTTNIIRATFR